MLLQRATDPWLLLLCALLCCRAVSGCTSGFMQLDLLKERAEKITNDNGVSDNFVYHGLRVWPGLNFTCSGSITGGMVGVDVRTGGGLVDYPQLGVWRIDNTAILLLGNAADIRLSLGDFSPDGVLQYNLTTPIPFQSGDVLGVYQTPSNESVVRMYFDNDPGAPYAEFTNGTNGGSFFGTPIVFFTDPDIIKQRVLMTVKTEPPECIGAGFLTPEQLRQETREVNINRVTTRNKQQRVFPDIRFTCSGAISKWIVGARAAGGSSSPSELQIWRRSGQMYTKVGSTQLTAQSPTSDPNVYEYTLSTPLEFQEGDFLGVYQDVGSTVVPYYQENTGPVNRRDSSLVSTPLNSLMNPPLAAEYDYPLVTVELAATASVSISTPNPASSSTSQAQEVEVHPSTVKQETASPTDVEEASSQQLDASSTSIRPSNPPSIPPAMQLDNTILYISVALIAGAILIVALTIFAVVIGICIWKRRSRKNSQHSVSTAAIVSKEPAAKRNSYLTTSFNKDDHQHGHIVIGTGPAMNMQQNECYDTTSNMKTDDSNEPMYEDLDAVVPKKVQDLYI